MKTSTSNSKFPWYLLGNNLFPEYNLRNKNDKKLIFVVDDQSVYANILGSLLEEEKYDVRVFYNGEDCIKNLHMNPDIVILDFELDEIMHQKMNGIDVLKYIKENHIGCEVVMLSGHEDVVVATTSIKLGAFDYVVKNENSFINIKNKMKNIYQKLNVLKELKEINTLKTKLVGLIIASGVFAVLAQFTFNHMS